MKLTLLGLLTLACLAQPVRGAFPASCAGTDYGHATRDLLATLPNPDGPTLVSVRGVSPRSMQ